jgi:hypothetical protein
MQYEIGEEVIYLDGDLERTGIIESINDNIVQICMLDGSLFITTSDKILYSLKY